MYVEFGEQLINSMYFGNIEKVDVNDNGTTKYLLRYEMTNGSVYDKDFPSQSARDDAYEQLKSSADGNGTLEITLTPTGETSAESNYTVGEMKEAWLAGKLIWGNITMPTGETGRTIISVGGYNTDNRWSFQGNPVLMMPQEALLIVWCPYSDDNSNSFVLSMYPLTTGG